MQLVGANIANDSSHKSGSRSGHFRSISLPVTACFPMASALCSIGMETMNLGDFLSYASIHSIAGEPLGDVPGFYLNLVLASGSISLCLTGAAADLPDRTEAFYLTPCASDSTDRWIGLDGRPVWESRDLLRSWGSEGIGGIWLEHRSVRYFFDREDRHRGLGLHGPLDSAAAIEFRGRRERSSLRAVLHAAPDYPCAVELATTTERCDEILAKLQEFIPHMLTTTPVAGAERAHIQ